MNPGLLFGFGFIALIFGQYAMTYVRYRKNKNQVDLLIKVISNHLTETNSIFGLLSQKGNPHHLLTGMFEDYQITCDAWKISQGNYRLNISAPPKNLKSTARGFRFMRQDPSVYHDFHFNGSAIYKTIDLDYTFQSDDAKNLLVELKKACIQVEQSGSSDDIN